MNRIVILILADLLMIVLFQGATLAQELPPIHEEISVQWWVVPVYAVGRDGKAVTDLSGEEIEVYLNRRRVEPITMLKKEFQIAKVQKEQPAEKEGTFIARKKLVFLIFDAALTHANLLGKAKKIAVSMLARPDKTSQYIVLTIEPYGGLTYLIGPEAGREEIIKTIRRKVHGKKSDFSGNKYLNSENIRYADPPQQPSSYIFTSPRTVLATENTEPQNKLDSADMKRIAASFQSSLQSLGVILGSFRESSKVVYLFSAGIPLKMFENEQKYAVDSGEGFEQEIAMIRPDMMLYKSLQSLASTLNRNGALLFVVNPGGTRISSTDPESGEMSLRVLADDGGGRYYAGTEKEVTDEVTAMEQAYYEIYFPDALELKGPEFDFEVKCRKPGISIYSLKRLARGKDYGEMSPLEREVLMLDVAQHGYYSQVKLKTIPFVLRKKTDAHGQEIFPVRLPGEMVGSDLDLYRIWINREKNDAKVELERIRPRNSEIEIVMKSREGYHVYAVLFDPRSRIAIVGGE